MELNLNTARVGDYFRYTGRAHVSAFGHDDHVIVETGPSRVRLAGGTWWHQELMCFVYDYEWTFHRKWPSVVQLPDGI